MSQHSADGTQVRSVDLADDAPAQSHRFNWRFIDPLKFALPLAILTGWAAAYAYEWLPPVLSENYIRIYW